MLVKLWGKKNSVSSNTCAPIGARSEGGGGQSFNAATWGLSLALISTPLVISADELDEAKKISFQIPQQRAHLSLIKFAEQAGITLIFPYDEVDDVVVNQLQGTYSVAEALSILLSKTGLTAKMGDNGQFRIVAKTSLKESEPMFDKNKISAAIVAFISTSLGSGSEESEAQALEEEIVVTGIRGSLQRSMDVKREAKGVVDSISAEDIGKFPDTNLAESLQRISGVSIDRSGGEGQFITVRGFGPEFNTVLFNGRQMATDNTGREFSFDLLAAELVDSVDVYKTSSAEVQSGGIGSTVNVRTAKPLDIGSYKAAFNVKGVYDENSDESTPQYSGLISNTFVDGSFGVLLSFAHQERKTRRNQASIDGWIANTDINSNREGTFDRAIHSPTGNTFVPRNYDQRVTFEDRKRTGGTLVLQFTPLDSLEFTADYLYSNFEIESEASSLGHWFTSSDFSHNENNPIIVDMNGTVVNFLQDNGATDFGARNFARPSKTVAIGLNVKWQATDQLALKFDLSRSKAELNDHKGNVNPLAIHGFLDNSGFDHTKGNTLPGIFGFQEANPNWYSEQQNYELAQIDAGTPQGTVDVSAPAGRGNYLDVSTPRTHVYLRRGNVINDEFNQFKIDGLWNEGVEQGLVSANFGILFSDQLKENTFVTNEDGGRHCIACGYFDRVIIDGEPIGEILDVPDSHFRILDAGNDFLSDLSGAGDIPHQWLQIDQEQAIALVENATGANMDARPSGSSFEVSEEILASYIQFEFAGELATMPLTVNTGFRYETTSVTVTGTSTTLDRLEVLDQTELRQKNGPSKPVSSSSDYNSFLPNMDAKLDIRDDIILRLSGSRTITRPTLSQMAPSVTIQTTRQGGDFRASSGNPELKPFESDNLDLSLEWYYGHSSYASAGYFKKDVDNFIVTNTTQDGLTFISSITGEDVTDPTSPEGSLPTENDPDDGIAYFDITAPENGESAEVTGFEVALQHSFWDTGFGVMLNYTTVSSDADFNPDDLSQNFAVTGLSDSRNAVLFYEKGRFQIRLAWNSRDEFLQSLSQVQGSGPTFVDAYEQYDISGSVNITDHLSVFFEGINITGEIPTKHGRYSNHFLLADDTGARWALGLRGAW